MKLKYTIDRASRIVLIHYDASPRFEEWSDTMRAVFADPDFEPGFSLLLDRRPALEAPTTDYIRSVISFVQSHQTELRETRCAVVVGNAASYGMARMAQALGAAVPFSMQVFTDMDEARRWLTQDKSPSEE